VNMPVMDGLEATRAIRSLNHKNTRAVPIIALTAAHEETEIEMCFDSGMSGFVEKPVSYDKLLAVITEHCL